MESLRQQRAARESGQDLPHPPERRPRGGIAGQIALFPRVLAHAEQFLADVSLTPDVRPFAVVEGPEQPGRLVQPSISAHLPS
jgi:hypothetical protein